MLVNPTNWMYSRALIPAKLYHAFIIIIVVAWYEELLSHPLRVLVQRMCPFLRLLRRHLLVELLQ